MASRNGKLAECSCMQKRVTNLYSCSWSFAYGRLCSGDPDDDLLDLLTRLVAPGIALATDHSSPSSSVLCCRLHLPPAVLVLVCCCPHFFLQISFSKCSFVARFLCRLVEPGVHCNACLVMLSSFLLVYVQANSISFFVFGPILAPDQLFFYNCLLAVRSGQCTLKNPSQTFIDEN